MVDLTSNALRQTERTDQPPAAAFTRMLADGYFACASVPVNMASATEALEAIRHAGERNREAFPVRRELNDQIGRAEDDRLRAVLMALREHHYAWTVTAHREWAAQATFDQWIDRFARAIEEWFFEVCRALLEHVPEVPAADAELVRALPETLNRMQEDDWNLASNTFSWLGAHPAVNTDTRARMLARLAQVALYFDGKPDAALSLVERAAELAKSDRAKAEVESARGQCQMKPGTTAGASTLERAAELDPRFVESFGYRGVIARDMGDLSTAELWFRRAIAAHPGSSVGYMHLAQLCCSRELAPERAREIDRILTLADAVEPAGAAEHHAAVAEYLIEVDLIDLAEQQADRAVASVPKRGRAHYVRGGIHALQERWAAALEDYRLARELEPIKYTNARFFSLGKRDALPVLLDELTRKPDDYVTQDAIFCFVQDAQSNDDLTPVALAALEQMQKVVAGSAVQARVANERGDLFYYSEDYEQAAREFRTAWTLEQSSTHGTNLVSALRKQKLWQEAEATIEKVYHVLRDGTLRARLGATVANEHAHEFFTSGDYPAAAHLYRRAAEHEPFSPVYSANYASALTMWFREEPTQELADRTNAAWQKVVELDPGNSEYAARAKNFAELAWGVQRFGADALGARAGVAPLRIFIGGNLIPFVKGAEEGTLTEEASTSVSGIRDWIWEDYGIRLPPIRFMPIEDEAVANGYALSLFEVITRSGRINPDMQLVVGHGAPGLVEALGVEVLPGVHPLSGDMGYWIPDDDVPIAHSRSVPVVTPIDYILSDLASVIISRLPEFLGHEELDDLLIENKLKTTRLTRLLQVVRGMLIERAPIVKLGAIHAHVEAAPETLTVGELLAQVRLLPGVCSELPGNNMRAVLRKLPPEHEQLFRNALVDHGPEKVIAMPLEDCQTLIESIRTIMMEEPPANALVVEDEVIRPFLRRFIAEDYPKLAVLSAREVASVRTKVEISQAPAAVSV